MYTANLDFRSLFLCLEGSKAASEGAREEYAGQYPARDIVFWELDIFQRRLPITNALRTCQPNQAPSTALL